MIGTTGTPVAGLSAPQTVMEGLLRQSVMSVAAEQQNTDTLYTRPTRGILGRRGLDSESLTVATAPAPSRLDRSLSMPTAITDKMLPPGLNKNLNLERYKTEMCHQFRESGFCKYGAKCQFAHGGTDLRSVNRHPKYKSDICRTYHSTGLCRYGIRCHFIHDEDEATLVRQRRLQSHYSGRHNPPQGATPRHHSLPCDAMSLGSAGDTPPGSTFSSPAPSPTGFMFSADTQPDRRPSLPDLLPASGAAGDVFSFQYVSQQPKPIQPPRATQFSSLASLAAGLQASVPRRGSESLIHDCLTDIFSLPDQYNMCESPMDVSRNLRLSVFSQLSDN